MLKKVLNACCTCLAFSAISSPDAQYVRLGVQGQLPMDKLGEMADMLGFPGTGQKVDHLTRLGVDPAIGKMAAEEILPGQKIELQPIKVRRSSKCGAKMGSQESSVRMNKFRPPWFSRAGVQSVIFRRLLP